MNLHDVAAWVRGVNESNGFDAPTWDNLPVKMILRNMERGRLHGKKRADG